MFLANWEIFLDTLTYDKYTVRQVRWNAIELAKDFKKDGWLENEFVDAVIHVWKNYDEFKYLFQDGRRIILPIMATRFLEYEDNEMKFIPEEIAPIIDYLIGNDDLTNADMVRCEAKNTTYKFRYNFI